MEQTDWLTLVKTAKKTAIIENGTRKVHFLLPNGKEMVEEYNLETNVLTRRAFRNKSDLGKDFGWEVDIGDPDPRRDKKNNDDLEIKESSVTPFITRRITKTSLEWRIRNLPYPINVYSVTATDDRKITVSTSNKKYFKKISVPELERVGLAPEQKLISFQHQYNTLIISYKKPQLVLDMEKKVLEEIMKVKCMKEGDVQCPTS